MQVDHHERIFLTIGKVSRFLGKLSSQPSAENIHKFRTHSRRVETVLQELVQDAPRNQKKLLKQLVRLRKKAGKLRDLDVQIAALRNLKVPQAAGSKAQLIRLLAEERAEREEQISHLFDKETVRDLRKRLKRAAAELQIPPSTDLLHLATQTIERLGRGNVSAEEKTLHQYRIVGKQARYIAELAGDGPEVRRFVDQLKRMQDVLGDWHDWQQLSEKAQHHCGGAEKSSLSAVLQNVTRAKFRQSFDVLTETRAALYQKSESTPPPRKPARATDPARAAVA